MRCLVTGCGGFIGTRLAEYLLERGETVCGSVTSKSRDLGALGDRIDLRRVDVADRAQVGALVAGFRPDVIFHLAAQSLPRVSWQDPERTIQVNVLGTLYLLDAIRNAGLDPRIVVLGSSSEYAATPPDEPPIGEGYRLEPSSPYALSKIAADQLSVLYARAYGLRVVVVRPFFVVGPRKVGDVASDFARGIIAIERGQQERLSVGNLEAVRDFLDVRDAVAALWLLSQKGMPGEAYNLSSGQGRSIAELLEILRSQTRVEVKVEPNPGLLRPLDEPVKVGDNTKLRDLGWKPTIPIEQTLHDVLEYWRDR